MPGRYTNFLRMLFERVTVQVPLPHEATVHYVWKDEADCFFEAHASGSSKTLGMH